MIIDFHTHIFPDAIAGKTIPFLETRSGITAATNGTAEGLLAAMNRDGVDLSIVLPVVTKPAQFDSINAFAKKINETYPGRLLSFGGIHPDCENYKEKLETIKALGLPGIKIHPDYQGVMIDDVRFLNIIEYADALDLIIVTHAGTDIGLPEPVHCPPERMRKVLDKLHPKRMVLAHLGGWQQWEAVEEYLAGEDVYLDTAFTFDYISEEMFYKIWQKHDKEKILFATDSPWGSAGRTLEQIRQLHLEEEAIQKLLGNNAKRLLGLVE